MALAVADKAGARGDPACRADHRALVDCHRPGKPRRLLCSNRWAATLPPRWRRRPGEGHGAPPGLLSSALGADLLARHPVCAAGVIGLGLYAQGRAHDRAFCSPEAGAWWLAVEVGAHQAAQLCAARPFTAGDPGGSRELLALPDEPAQAWRRLLPWIAALQFTIVLAALVAAPLLLPKYYAFVAARHDVTTGGYCRWRRC